MFTFPEKGDLMKTRLLKSRSNLTKGVGRTVVGGDKHAPHERGSGAALPHMLYHGLAVQVGQRLAGETRRRVTRGNDDKDGGCTHGQCIG